MTRIDEAISDALGIQQDIKQEIIDPKPLPERALTTLDARSDEVDIDYKYSRENFYNLIERGQDAITGILDLAKEQEHPRTYEVAGQLIKTVSEVTERLADLQEKMQKLKEVPDKGPTNVTNALFIGSTKELQALIKEKPNGS
ncbi:MAG: hypothetical protein QF704_10340 [Anaerolineales bacterium]|nr:hypothetical protein [Anaerolineales bacterium]